MRGDKGDQGVPIPDQALKKELTGENPGKGRKQRNRGSGQFFRKENPALNCAPPCAVREDSKELEGRRGKRSGGHQVPGPGARSHSQSRCFENHRIFQLGKLDPLGPARGSQGGEDPGAHRPKKRRGGRGRVHFTTLFSKKNKRQKKN